MQTSSFADLNSYDTLRTYFQSAGYQSVDAPADQLFDLSPDQRLLFQGARIIAVGGGTALDDNTLLVLWVPRRSLPLEMVRRIRARLAETTRDGLLFCTQDWQHATLYALRQDDVSSAESDTVLRWELNLHALRPADRQGLEQLDIHDADPFELGARLQRAFQRARRETLYRNQGLFSNYYLNERLADDPVGPRLEWAELADSMPALRTHIEAALTSGTAAGDLEGTLKQVIRPLLHALGWDVKGKSEQLELHAHGATMAFCHVLPWKEALDSAPLPPLQLTMAELAPDMQLIGRLAAQKTVLWGILTNGVQWRLISRQAASASGVFYEIDLPDLLALSSPDSHELRWFAGFFGAAWLYSPSGLPGHLSKIYQAGQLAAEELAKNLKAAIFKDVFVDLANALAEGANRSALKTDLPTVYRATLVLLYRLLFVLYAESRRLLPLASADYYPHSLTYLLSTLALKKMPNSSIDPERDFSLGTHDTRLWQRLNALFTAIGAGKATWNIPLYNGGLFADTTSPAHQLLADLSDIANDYLVDGLDRLARQEKARNADSEHDALRLIDYMDLDVRRLGSIYEGLLEFQLRRAEQDGEVRHGKLEPVTPGRRASGRIVQRNEVYLETTRQDRKASGSYYTPDYIVRYIVEQTVGPVLEVRKALFKQQMDSARTIQTALKRNNDTPAVRILHGQLEDTHSAAIEALLDIKVLDPAMGSGHFLVAAVNYLSDQIIAILRDYSDNPLLPKLASMRGNIRKSLEAQGLKADSVPDEKLKDTVLLRRMVMKRCIYGVDLNDMAVELAKLSLWLDSFAVGAPLSFLDHHLRWGNSLIGIWDVEINILPAMGYWKEFMRALSAMVSITKLTDSTNDEVHESQELYKQAQENLRPFRERFNVDLARHFIDMGDKGKLAQAQRVARDKPEERAGKHDPASIARFDMAQQEAAERRFFHWKLEFPEVFIDHERSDWKAESTSGFDAVVGNPPYIRESGNKSIFSYFQKSDHFLQYYQGKTDIYFYFTIQALWLANECGGLGYIIPANWLEAVSSVKLRKFLQDNSQIQSIVVFRGLQVFEDAAVEPLIIITNKRGKADTFLYQFRTTKHIRAEDVILSPEVINIPISSLKSDGWYLKGNSIQGIDTIVERLTLLSLNLGEFFHVEAGVNTGADYVSTRSRAHWPSGIQQGQGIFVIDKEELVQIQFSKIERNYIRKYIPPEYVDRYSQEEDDNHFLIYLKRDDDIENLPYIKNHLSKFKSILENRAEILRNPSRRWWHLLWPREQEVYERPEKLVIANATARNSFYVDSEQTYYNIGCTVLSILANVSIDTNYAAALLNAKLLDRWYELRGQTQAETQRKYFPDKVRQIPIRRIHFTTPAARRTALAAELTAEALAFAEQERTLPLEHSASGWPRYDAAAFRSAPLGKRIAALLPQDTQGTFLAFADGATGSEEQSDVVHDLLAALAKRMIDLNKQKQAEIKRFLSDLETKLDITTDKNGRTGIDSLNKKRTIQNYLGDYQKNEPAQPWETICAVLHKNRKRFVNDGWLSNQPQIFEGAVSGGLTRLQSEYQASLNKLRPIKRQLARTDALIDQIVYMLYGLTLEEIAVVEA